MQIRRATGHFGRGVAERDYEELESDFGFYFDVYACILG
jgi:hypothetical protein